MITKEKLLEQGFVEGQYKNIPYFRKGERVLAYSDDAWIPSRFMNGALVFRDFRVNFMEELDFIMNQ